MDALLRLTLRSLMFRRKWTAYRHIIDEQTFNSSVASSIYQLLLELHAASKRNVSKVALTAAVEATTGGKHKKELLAAVDELMEVDKDDLEDADYAIRQYVARTKALKASTLVGLHVDDPQFSYAVPARMLADAARISSGAAQERLCASSAGLPGDATLERHAVPLGLSPKLDTALLGGVGRGELLVLLAPPKRGKTSYLWRMATNAVLAGETVLAVTMEIRPRKCWLRYYQSLTGLTYTEMVKNRQLIAARRAQAKGDIVLLDYSSQRFTPNMLETEIEQAWDDGLPISFVMIDYLEIMQPSYGWGHTGKNFSSLGDMVVDVRQLAGRFDLPVVTAWQVNRVGTDKTVFCSTDISESYEVIKHADIILGLNQSNEELRNNIMRMQVMEQRESPERPLIHLHSDMTRNLIHDLEGAPNGTRTKNINRDL